MLTLSDLKWPFVYPFRQPRKPGTGSPETLLAVAVFNDQIPNSSFVQGIYLESGIGGTLTASIPGLTVSGMTPGNSTSKPFYLQGAWELLNQGTVLPPTQAQAGPSGAYSPMYWPNSINYFGGNLYVIGSDEDEFGVVLRFDATTGNPNGSGSSPATDPLFLSLDVLLENTGMSLVTVQGNTALAIPLATGIAACILGGTATPSLKGPIPYSAFQGTGLPTQLALTAPCQSSTTGTIYFLYFDGMNPSGGAGLMSVNPTDVENAILLGSTNVPVTVITALGSLPVTSAWCVGQINQQDVVYVAIPSWANLTTALWSISWINAANGATTPWNLNLPGQAWGMCVVTVLA